VPALGIVPFAIQGSWPSHRGWQLWKPLSDYLHTIPDDWLPRERKQLVQTLLETRLEWLTKQ